MVAAPSEPRAKIDRLGTKLYLLWAGLSIGVAFLATPANSWRPRCRCR